jgi:hypothetical protein
MIIRATIQSVIFQSTLIMCYTLGPNNMDFTE